MKLPKWVSGRQNTDKVLYQRLTLFVYEFLSMDGHLIKVTDGGEIPEHVDLDPRGSITRLNIVISKAEEGGEFICKDGRSWFGRVFKFDTSKPHSVTKCKGTRIVLSFGYLRKNP